VFVRLPLTQHYDARQILTPHAQFGVTLVRERLVAIGVVQASTMKQRTCLGCPDPDSEWDISWNTN
jgi:hypothetical protein